MEASLNILQTEIHNSNWMEELEHKVKQMKRQMKTSGMR